MFLFCCLIFVPGMAKGEAPQEAWHIALTMARNQSLQHLLIVLADSDVNVNWPSLLKHAPPFTLFTEASHVPKVRRLGGLLLASKPKSLVAGLVELRKKHLTGYGARWVLVLSSLGKKRLHVPGLDGEQLALLLPPSSPVISACPGTPNETAGAVLYSLWSSGNGSVCWRHVDDPSKLFEPYPYDFAHRTLRVVSLGATPVRKKPATKTEWRWSGFVFDVLNYIADSLNFRYQSREPQHHYYFAELFNGTPVGVIGDVAREAADVAAGDLSWTAARGALVDFTSFILDDAVTFVYWRGISEPGLWTVLRPFPLSVWCLMLAAMLLVTTLLFSFNVARASLLGSPDSSSSSQSMLSAGTLALQSLHRQDCPPESGPRPLLGCWYVVCLVMSTVYCGRLTAFSLATLEEPVYSLDVLVQRRPSTIVLVKNGSLPFEVLKRPAYDFLWRRRLVRVVRASTSVDDLLAKVQRRKFAWMAEAAFGGARIREQRLQGLAVARTSMAASRWCLALGKGSPLLPHFDRKILQLWSHGLIDRLKKAYFHGEPMPAPEPTRPLTLANCKASFWMWFLGLLLASAACVCERLLQVRRIKMPPHKASPHGEEMVHPRRRRSKSTRRNRSRSTQAQPQPKSLWHVQPPVWPSGQFPYSNTRRLMRSCDT